MFRKFVFIIIFMVNYSYGNEFDVSTGHDENPLNLDKSSITLENMNSEEAFSIKQNQPNWPQQSPTPPPTEDTAAECNSAFKAANVACKGDEINRAVMPMITSFQFAQKSGNAKEACSSAKQLNTLGLGITTAFAAACKSAQQKCVSICTKEAGSSTYNLPAQENLKECQKYSENWLASIAQGVMYAGQMMMSGQCEKMAGGECDPGNQETFDNPACINYYCTKPGRLNDPKCNQMAALCNDPNNRTQPMCICYANPNHPSCPNGKPPDHLAPGTMPGGTGGDPSELTEGLFDELDPPSYMGNGDKQKAGGAGVAGGRGGGGGGLGGGSGGAAGYQPSGDGYGGSGSGVDPNILTGVGRSASGGYNYGASGLTAGSSGSRGSASSSGSGRNGKELNLRDFLPGGKKDARSLASQKSLASQGISEAEGLSNWVKVSRKISQKRSTLMP